jgi:hypothetical protein
MTTDQCTADLRTIDEPSNAKVDEDSNGYLIKIFCRYLRMFTFIIRGVYGHARRLDKARPSISMGIQCTTGACLALSAECAQQTTGPNTMVEEQA